MLLNAGARSYATNKIGKTAAEMAAFVGKRTADDIYLRARAKNGIAFFRQLRVRKRN